MRIHLFILHGSHDLHIKVDKYWTITDELN